MARTSEVGVVSPRAALPCRGLGFGSQGSWECKGGREGKGREGRKAEAEAVGFRDTDTAREG